MGSAIRYLFYLAILCIVIVAGYALFFDLPAPQSEVTIPIETDLSG